MLHDAGTGVRGERTIDRTAAAWQSQQVQEPCILENPKDSERLVMFYSGVETLTQQNGPAVGGDRWLVEHGLSTRQPPTDVNAEVCSV